MENENDLKELVKQKYSEITLQDKDVNQSSCCGSGCCSDEVYNIMSEDYQQLEGYNPLHKKTAVNGPIFQNCSHTRSYHTIPLKRYYRSKPTMIG